MKVNRQGKTSRHCIFFSSTYCSRTLPYKISNLLRIAYEEITRIASFKLQIYQPDPKTFLVDLLTSKIDGSESFLGQEKNPKYWQYRQRLVSFPFCFGDPDDSRIFHGMCKQTTPQIFPMYHRTFSESLLRAWHLPALICEC